jgi:hypothetical protein
MTGKKRLDIVYSVLVIILAMLLMQQYYDLLNSWTGGNDQGQTEESAVYDEAKLMQPFEIAVSSGRQEGRSAVVTHQIQAYYEVYAASWDFLMEMMEAGPQAETTGYEELNTNRPVCRYIYTTPRNGEMFLQALPQETIISGFAAVRDAGRYSSIWIVPAENAREDSYIYLVGGTDSVIRLSAKISRDRTEALLEEMRGVCDKVSERYYDCAVFYLEIFTGHMLLRDQNDPEVYTPWRIRWNESFTQETVFRYVRDLFSYPEVVQAQQSDEDTWIFTDDKVSVRIGRNGMLYYIHTPSAGQADSGVRLSVADAYDIAVSFVTSDLANDGQPISFYLDGWETTDTGYIFRWNYQKDGRAVYPDESLLESEGMQSGLQLEIRGEEVYRYQCLKIRLESAVYRTQVLTESAFSIIGGMPRGNYDSIRLVYRMENSTAVPYWELLQGDDKSYIKGR